MVEINWKVIFSFFRLTCAMAAQNVTKVVITLDYNGTKKRYRSQGSSWDDHFKSLSDTISSKYGKTLNSDVHVAVEDKTISSPSELGSVLEGQSKATLFVKDGAGVATKKAVVICNGNRCEWQASVKDIEKDSSFELFCSFVRKSFELGNDSIIKVYQIDNENDIDNESVEIEEADDFPLCFDEVDTAYFCLKGDVSFKGYEIEVDVSGVADDEKENKVKIKIPFTDTDDRNAWLQHFDIFEKEIGKKLKNDSWQQSFALLDNEGVEVPDLDDFILALESAGDSTDSGSSGAIPVSFSLSKKESTGYTVLIDLSQVGINSKLEINIIKLDPESNENEWKSEFSGVCDKIGTKLGNNDWQQQYQLFDTIDDVPIESSEEFSFAFGENDGTSPVCLVLQKLKGEDKKLFMFTLGAGSVSWEPDLEKDKGKSWKIHYRKLLRVLRKEFGNDEMRGMSLYYNYSLNVDINSNKIENCNKLDDSTIETFWNILNNDNNNNNVSTMSFIISKNAPSPPNSKINNNNNLNNNNQSSNPNIQQQSKVEPKLASKEEANNDEYDNKNDSKEMELNNVNSKDKDKDNELLAVSKIENNSKLIMRELEKNSFDVMYAEKLSQVSENDAIKQALVGTKQQWEKVEPHLDIVKNISNWEGGIMPLTNDNIDFAQSIEQSVKEVMRTRWDMQSSLMIVRSVMDLNPGNAESVGWKKIKTSCQDIFSMSLDALAASLEINGGFLVLRNGINKMGKRKTVRNLAVAVLPFERAMKDFDNTVSKVANTTSKLRGTIEKSLNNIRDIAPGLQGGEQFSQLLDTIDQLKKEKQEKNKQLDEKEEQLDKLENKFNGLLGAIAPSKVAEWHHKRLLSVQIGQNKQRKEQEIQRQKRQDRREKIKNEVKNIDNNNNNNSSSNEEVKNEEKNNNAVVLASKESQNQVKIIDEIYKDLTSNLEEILQEKMPEQVTKELELAKRSEILENSRKFALAQKNEYEIAKKNAGNKHYEATLQTNDHFNAQIQSISRNDVDLTELDSNIDRFGINAEKYTVQSKNASNWGTTTVTDHHSSTSGWWFWRKKRTWTTTRTVSTYTGRKSNLERQARAAREAKAAVEQLRKEKLQRFEDAQKKRQALAKQAADLMQSRNDNALNNFKNHCDNEISLIKKELENIDNKEIEIKKERAAIELKCKTYKDNVRNQWDILQNKRKEFDRFSIECNERIIRLESKQEEYEEYKDRWNMSANGILNLFKVVPYLMDEAENAAEVATRMGASFKAFAKIVSANKGKGLTFGEACEMTNHSQLKIFENDLAKENLKYCGDFSCDDRKEFNLLIKPAINKILKTNSITKNLSGDEKEQYLYRFQKFCVQQEYAEIQEETLETAKEELKDMALGLDKFCGYIYERSNQVDKLLTAYSRKMKTITLIPRTNNEKKDENKNKIANNKQIENKKGKSNIKTKEIKGSEHKKQSDLLSVD